MPILGGILSGLFVSIFNWLEKRLTLNIAFYLAALATVTAAWLAFKAAMAAIWLTLPALSIPTAVTTAMALVFPANIGTCIAGIITADVVATSWKQWRSILKTAADVSHYIT
jgi:hypothetical protein